MGSNDLSQKIRTSVLIPIEDYQKKLNTIVKKNITIKNQ